MHTAVVRITLVIIVSCLLLMPAAGCSSSSSSPADTDGDADDEVLAEESPADTMEVSEELGDPDSEAVEEESVADETEETLETPARQLIANTTGYCQTNITPDDSCDTDADCIGYFTAPYIDCQQVAPNEGYLELSPSCLFARAATFPTEPVCSADDRCIDAPRTCLDHHCKPAEWDLSCTADADCAMVDMGCACIGVNTTAGTPALTFGRQCPASGACPTGAQVRCQFNRCFVVGSFLDEVVDHYCEICAESLGSSKDACIANGEKDNYALVCQTGSMIPAAMAATTCAGFLMGPGRGFAECMTTK